MTKLFRKEKDEGTLVVVFDIASASVGGVLFVHRKKFAPEIIASVRESVDFSKYKKLQEKWNVMNNALTFVFDQLKKKTPRFPQVALCVFSSPWFVAQTRIIKINREKSFEINENILDEALENELEIFRKEWSSGEGQIFKKEEVDSLLEKSTIKIILNGYEVESPFGKRARSVKLFSYLSLGIGFLKKKIKENISTNINFDNIYFNSFPFVLLRVLADIVNTKNGAIFIDMSGEITDVFIVRDGVMEEMSSLPIGENFFIKRISSAFNLKPEESKSQLAQFKRGDLNKTQMEKISKILDPAVKKWGEYLGQLLNEVSENNFLPQNLYFCGYTPIIKLEQIKKLIGGENFAELTIFNKPLGVSFLESDSLKFHFDFKNNFTNYKDVSLLISVLFVDKFLE